MGLPTTPPPSSFSNSICHFSPSVLDFNHLFQLGSRCFFCLLLLANTTHPSILSSNILQLSPLGVRNRMKSPPLLAPKPMAAFANGSWRPFPKILEVPLSLAQSHINQCSRTNGSGNSRTQQHCQPHLPPGWHILSGPKVPCINPHLDLGSDHFLPCNLPH